VLKPPKGSGETDNAYISNLLCSDANKIHQNIFQTWTADCSNLIKDYLPAEVLTYHGIHIIHCVGFKVRLGLKEPNCSQEGWRLKIYILKCKKKMKGLSQKDLSPKLMPAKTSMFAHYLCPLVNKGGKTKIKIRLP